MKYFDNLPSIEKIWGKGNPDYDGTLSIVVVGASGNLAMLKVSEYLCLNVDISCLVFLVLPLASSTLYYDCWLCQNVDDGFIIPREATKCIKGG